MVVALRQGVADGVADALAGGGEDGGDASHRVLIARRRADQVRLGVEEGDGADGGFLSARPVYAAEGRAAFDPVGEDVVEGGGVAAVAGNDPRADQVVGPTEAGRFPDVFDVDARIFAREGAPPWEVRFDFDFVRRAVPGGGSGGERAPDGAVRLVVAGEDAVGAGEGLGRVGGVGEGGGIDGERVA